MILKDTEYLVMSSGAEVKQKAEGSRFAEPLAKYLGEAQKGQVLLIGDKSIEHNRADFYMIRKGGCKCGTCDGSGYVMISVKNPACHPDIVAAVIDYIKTLGGANTKLLYYDSALRRN